MGLITRILGLDAKSISGAVVDVAEVFRPNAENEAQRTADFQSSSLSQFQSEFAHERKGWFDRFIDGVNRLPRPIMALGTMALLGSAMYDPIWFNERMIGLAYVPDPLWWLLGAVVSFYFGARELHHSRTRIDPVKIQNTLTSLRAAEETPEDVTPVVSDNPALTDWRNSRT